MNLEPIFRFCFARGIILVSVYLLIGYETFHRVSHIYEVAVCLFF